MSHGGKWRGSGASRKRDIYRSWLHRVVRPNWLSALHARFGLRVFLGNVSSAGVCFGPGAGDFVEYW